MMTSLKVVSIQYMSLPIDSSAQEKQVKESIFCWIPILNMKTSNNVADEQITMKVNVYPL